MDYHNRISQVYKRKYGKKKQKENKMAGKRKGNNEHEMRPRKEKSEV